MQIVKAVLLMTGAVADDLAGAGAVQVQPVRRCSATPPTKSGKGEAFLEPGLRYGVEMPTLQTFYSKIDLLSPRPRAGARHRRPAAHPDPLLHRARPPRPPASRVLWAIGIIGTFYLITLALGFGAAALVGTARRSAAQDTAGNTAAPQLAQALGGVFGGDLGGADPARDHRGGRLRHHPRRGRRADPGLVVQSVAHDFYANVIKKGRRPSEQEVRVARIAAARHRRDRDRAVDLRRRT